MSEKLRMKLDLHPPEMFEDWRCATCGKLIGRRRGNELYIRVRHHEYIVALPAQASCSAHRTRRRPARAR